MKRASGFSRWPACRVAPRRSRSLLRLEEFEPRVTPSCNLGLTAGVLTVTCDTSLNTVTVDHNSTTTTVNGVNFADSTFNSIQINIGAGPGTVDLLRTPASPLNINEAGFGNVDVNVSPTVQSLNVIQGAVSITGGLGFHTLVVNDQQAPIVPPPTYTMTPTSLTRTLGASPINFGTQMHLLTVKGGSGANIYNVAGTGGLNTTTLQTGNGNDTINVENTTGVLSVVEQGFGNDIVNVSPSAQNLDNIHAGITIAGNSGVDTLNIDDQNNPMGRTYTLTATSMHRDGAAAIDFGTLMNFINVNGGNRVNPYNITGTGSLNLTTLRTGGGNDTINVEDTNSGHPLSVIEQFSGNDTVNVSPSVKMLNNVRGAVSIAGNAGNDTLIVNDGNDTTGVIYTVTATSIADNNPASATISFTGMNQVALIGGNGADIYNVTGTGGRVSNLVQTSNVNNGNIDFVNILATTHPFTVNLGRFASSVDVSSMAHNLITIQGAVTVVGRVGTLSVDDQGNTSSGLTYTLTSNSVTRTGAALISFSGGAPDLVVNVATENNGNTYNVTGTQPGFSILNLHHTQSANDTVNVQATSGPLIVHAGLGDRANVGNSGSVQDIRGDLDLGLLTFVTVDDHLENRPRSVIMDVNSLGDATISGLAPAVITYGQNNIAGVTVKGGSAGNIFNVRATVSNGLLPVTTINSGSGDDTINVGNTLNTLNDIRGALTVNGEAGVDTLNINDQGSTIAHHYTVTATTVVRSRPSEPTVTITYADIESLNLHVGAHFAPGTDTNLIDVLSTDAGTAVEVDGGSGATVNVGNDQDGLDELQGPLTVNGGDGTVLLNINDQMTPDGQVYDLMPGELDRSNAAPITFLGVQQEVLTGGGNSNRFDVDGVMMNSPATINAGKGGDLVRMRQHDRIQDALTLYGQGNTAIGYVAYTTDVFVDLQLGLATDVASFSGLSRITGGGGNNILVGDGNEDIIGGSGRNLIISGGGTGQITGGGQGDILIGGATAYDQDFTSLQAILGYWTGSPDDYATRVANLRAGKGVPQLEAQISVFDNGAANTLTGNGDQSQGVFNLFFVTEAGTVTDQQPDEVVVDIDGGNAPHRGGSARITAPVGASLPHRAAFVTPFRSALAMEPSVTPQSALPGSDVLAADLVWQTVSNTSPRGPLMAADLAWSDGGQPSAQLEGNLL